MADESNLRGQAQSFWKDNRSYFGFVSLIYGVGFVVFFLPIWLERHVSPFWALVAQSFIVVIAWPYVGYRYRAHWLAAGNVIVWLGIFIGLALVWVVEAMRLSGVR